MVLAGVSETRDPSETLPRPFQATLFALGIRADTGALSYPDTTARDGHALVWLMEAPSPPGRSPPHSTTLLRARLEP